MQLPQRGRPLLEAFGKPLDDIGSRWGRNATAEKRAGHVPLSQGNLIRYINLTATISVLHSTNIYCPANGESQHVEFPLF